MEFQRGSYPKHLRGKNSYVKSLDSRRFNSVNNVSSLSCSTHLPQLNTKETMPNNSSGSIDQHSSREVLPIFIPKRLDEADLIYKRVLREKAGDRTPQEKTLSEIKKELFRAIDRKRKQAIIFQGQEKRMRWQIDKEAKQKIVQAERMEEQQWLRSRDEQRTREQKMIQKRKQQQIKFLQVGKRRMNTTPSPSVSSVDYLKGDIEDLRSKLRVECMSALVSKDSYKCVMRVMTPNPQ